MTKGHNAVEILFQTSNGLNKFVLNRYYADTNIPRPEGFKEDMKTASHLTDADLRHNLFSNLVAGAESGWDFSSRWFSDNEKGLKSINILDIIPVELNAYLAGVERILSKLHENLEHTEQSNMYYEALTSRIEAMHHVLYSESRSQWIDYNYVDKRSNFGTKALSNFIPLWTKAYDTTGKNAVNVQEIISALNESGLLNYPGGIPMTLNNYGQQ